MTNNSGNKVNLDDEEFQIIKKDIIYKFIYAPIYNPIYILYKFFIF